MKKIFFVCVGILLAGCSGSHEKQEHQDKQDKQDKQGQVDEAILESQQGLDVSSQTDIVQDEVLGDHVVAGQTQMQEVDFSAIDSAFLFSGLLDDVWEAQYIADIGAINVFDPRGEGQTSLENSQIFIRSFEAPEFLTLDTVEIFSQISGQIAGRASVTYDIEKKEGIANFPSQPTWRNERHFVTDVRYKQGSPSVFYVFARNPQLDEEVFVAFMQSLRFNADNKSVFVTPLSDSSQRITKKPFGLYVTPENSPVPNERFTGFHSGTDFEVSDAEIDQDIEVRALCQGVITSIDVVSGYGGVIRQTCENQGSNLYIIYGHVSIEDTIVTVGQSVASGEKLTILGDDRSAQTDGERKHLHLGISTKSDIRGYVPTEQGLSTWIDYEALTASQEK